MANGAKFRSLLITGGAGFIGSNFIHYMHQKYPDYLLVNLDALTYAGNLENLDSLAGSDRYVFYKGDICDMGFVDKIVTDHGVDAIINFAAESHVDRSIENPAVFVKTNIEGTQILLEVARRHNLQKFVQISTDEVYGSLGAEGYFTETTNLAPNSPYSASKTGADLLVRAYYKTFGLPVNITRCSNNYGPYQFPEKLIPLMISNALENKSLPVYGDGLNVRDWLYVEDHCSAIDTVLHEAKVGEVYNIGGNNEKTNIDIVKTLLNTLGKPESLITYVKDRPGHDRRYAIDAGKIKRDLGWEPRVDFAEGMKMTVEWYLANRPWWEKIKSGEYQGYYEKMYGNR